MLRSRRHRALIAVALGASFVVPIATAPPASAAVCSTTWSGGGGDGRWGTAANWTSGVPGASSDACIGGTQTYTVVADASITLHSLTMDGTAGTQTLRIQSTGATLLTTIDSTQIGPTGTIELAGDAHSWSSAGTGIVNDGRIVASAPSVVLRALPVVNRGRIDVGPAATLNVFLGSIIANDGTVAVATGATLTVPGGGSWTSSFDNRTGTIANSGTVLVQGGRFTQRAATVTGTAVRIDGGTWAGLGSGAGTFDITASTDVEGGTAVGQTLRIGSPTNTVLVNAATAFTNAGTIETNSPAGGGEVFLGTSSATWTNTGTIRLASPAVAHIRTGIVNRGTIAVTSGTHRFDYPTTLLNDGGTITTAAGTSLRIESTQGSHVVHRAGTISNAGSIAVGGGYGTTSWDQEAGTVTGNPIELNGATWNGLGDGAAAFSITGPDNHATGRIAPSQKLSVHDDDSGNGFGQGFLNVSDTFANDGTLELTNISSTGAHDVMVGPATATLTNRGTFVSNGPATTLVRLNVVNQGSLDVRAGELRMDVSRTLTNSGTLILRSAARLWTNGVVATTATGVTEFHAAGPTTVGRIVSASGNPAGVPLGGRAKPVFVAPYLPAPGTRLTVVEGAHQGDFATVDDGFTSDVTDPAAVRLVAPAMFITTGAVPDGTVGQPFTVTLASAWSVAPVAWTVTGATPPGLGLSGAGVLSGTPTQAGDFAIDVTATDSAATPQHATARLTVRILKRGSSTSLTSSANPATTGQSVTFTAQVVGTSPTGGVEFRDGTTVLGTRTLAGGAATLTTSALTAGSHAITATYAGDANHTGSASPTVTQVVGQAPAITSPAAASFTIGTASTFTVTATGSPAPTVTITGALPSGLSVSGATITGTPAAGTAGSYPLTVRAANGNAPDATQTLTLTVVNPFTAPALTSANTATFTRGQAGAFQVTASGNPAPVISVNGSLPAGLTINNGRIAGTPTVTGTFPTGLVANNGIAPNATQTLTITIIEPTAAPVFTSPTTATFTRGQAGAFQVTATGNPAPVISVNGSLPAGLTISNGRISGTPTVTGTFPTGLVANNGIAPNATQTLTITVTDPSAAPAITSPATASFTMGVPGSFTITATGSPAPTITVNGSLPRGLTRSGSTISGTPAYDQDRTFVLQVRAANGVRPDATQTLRITLVDPRVAPRITSPNAATFTVGVAGSFTATASGNPAPRISISGRLPNGLTRNGATITGTPAAGTAGTYTLQVTADNDVRPNDVQVLRLTVVQPGVAPTITSAASTTFIISKRGQFVFTASGTPTPTITVTGSLPRSLVLRGNRLEGEPGWWTVGSYPLTVTASNGTGPAVSQSFTLNVTTEPADLRVWIGDETRPSPIPDGSPVTQWMDVRVIVRNVSDAWVLGTKVYVQIPPGMTFFDWSGDYGCVATGQLLTCDPSRLVPVLMPGGRLDFDVSVQTTLPVGTRATITASTSSPAGDTNPSDNTASYTFVVW